MWASATQQAAHAFPDMFQTLSEKAYTKGDPDMATPERVPKKSLTAPAKAL